VTAALDLAESDAKAAAELPWLAFRLVQLAAKAGMLDRASQLAGRIPDSGLKGQALLVVFRARLAGTKDKADESLAAALTENTGAAAQARQMLGRHNVALDSGWAKNVENWSEADRAAGLAGVALGLQDRRK